ncbi:MAG: T9SS type A sorting domain-containing protein [Bacteroidales bacterium]|nr:T9SS type A sorting domain-containing protein [Bacteroidales bacterium]
MKKFYSSLFVLALFTSVGMTQDVKKVLVMVGSELADSAKLGVKNPVDAIKSINGIDWEFDYIIKDSIETFTDFTSYDLAFVTENPGSVQAAHWGTSGVKALPTLNYKAWAIRLSRTHWPLVDNLNSEDNWYTYKLPNTDVHAETNIKVIEDHAILADLGVAAGDTFSLSSQVAAEWLGKITVQTFNITDDADIVTNATAVATSTIAVDSARAAVNILYAIDENPSSKKHVVLGTAQQYLEYPTEEMAKLTTGAVKWLLDIGVGISNNRLADFNTSVYPNPANQTATVQFNVKQSATVDIVVMSVLGQTVHQHANSYSQGIQNELIDVSGFAPGLYFVEVQMNGQQQVQKLLVK